MRRHPFSVASSLLDGTDDLPADRKVPHDAVLTHYTTVSHRKPTDRVISFTWKSSQAGTARYHTKDGEWKADQRRVPGRKAGRDRRQWLRENPGQTPGDATWDEEIRCGNATEFAVDVSSVMNVTGWWPADRVGPATDTFNGVGRESFIVEGDPNAASADDATPEP